MPQARPDGGLEGLAGGPRRLSEGAVGYPGSGPGQLRGEGGRQGEAGTPPFSGSQPPSRLRGLEIPGIAEALEAFRLEPPEIDALAPRPLLEQPRDPGGPAAGPGGSQVGEEAGARGFPETDGIEDAGRAEAPAPVARLDQEGPDPAPGQEEEAPVARPDRLLAKAALFVAPGQGEIDVPEGGPGRGKGGNFHLDRPEDGAGPRREDSLAGAEDRTGQGETEGKAGLGSHASSTPGRDGGASGSSPPC